MLDHYTTYRALEVKQENRLLRLTLNSPDTLNGVGVAMHPELEDFFYRVRSDTTVGAILLTGAGRVFSAGGDINDLADVARHQADAVGVAQIMRNTKTLFTNMLGVPQPIVCAVHGYAMGVAASIALCSDVVIAATDAVIADTHVSIGLVAGDGGPVLWPLLMPLNTAKYYLMTGDRITGTEAERLGLVLRAVPPENLHAHAEQIAIRLADGPALAIQGIKATVNKVVHARADLLFDSALALEGVTMLSADYHEAITALVEKRSPTFNNDAT